MRNAKVACWLVIAAAPVYRYWLNHHGMPLAASFTPLAVMDSIALGCLMAIYRKRSFKYGGWLLVFAMVLPLAEGIGHVQLLRPLPQLAGHLLWSTFNVCVAFGMVWAVDRAPKFLNWRPLAWIGTLSYSLYLFQMPFMNADRNIPLGIRLGGVLCAALLSFYLIEQPILAWRAKVRRAL